MNDDKNTTLVPATLDLSERASLAVNAMTEATDPSEDYRVYWKVTFRSTPPIMYHDFSDAEVNGAIIRTLRMCAVRILCMFEEVRAVCCAQTVSTNPLPEAYARGIEHGHVPPPTPESEVWTPGSRDPLAWEE